MEQQEPQQESGCLGAFWDMIESSGRGSTVGSSPEEMGSRYLLELEIAEGCETPSACWDSNLGPLREQQVFLTTEPFLQPKSLHFRLFLF